MSQKLLWVFTYDVADDRRRLRVMKQLRNIGVRVNYSVFECVLTAGEAEALTARLAKLLRRGKDHLRVYGVCASCQQRRSMHGTYRDPNDPVVHVE